MPWIREFTRKGFHQLKVNVSNNHTNPKNINLFDVQILCLLVCIMTSRWRDSKFQHSLTCLSPFNWTIDHCVIALRPSDRDQLSLSVGLQVIPFELFRRKDNWIRDKQLCDGACLEVIRLSEVHLKHA